MCDENISLSQIEKGYICTWIERILGTNSKRKKDAVEPSEEQIRKSKS